MTPSPAEAPLLLELKGVKKSYVIGKTEVQALRGIDLKVARGEMVAISGVSGSGKSTLLNLLGGIDRPSEGSILFEGQDISHMNGRQLTRFRARHIGFIFQNFNLIPSLNVFENIVVPMKLKGQTFDRAEVLDLISEVGLGDFIRHKPDELSGGQKQRVAIARSLVHTPPLVLADEITANLDTQTAVTIINLLVEINRKLKVTLLFASHDQRVLSIIERRVALQDGVIHSPEN